MRLDLAYDFFNLLYRNILSKLITEFHVSENGGLGNYVCKRTSDVLLKYFYFSSYNSMYKLSVSIYQENYQNLTNCIIVENNSNIWRVITDKELLIEDELYERLDNENNSKNIGDKEIIQIIFHKNKVLQAYVGYCINHKTDIQTYYLWKFKFNIYHHKDSLTRLWKIGKYKAKLLLKQFRSFYEQQKESNFPTSRTDFLKSPFSMVIPEDSTLIENKFYFNHTSFRDFKLYMGTSVYDYYIWIRLQECLSMILISNTDIQIIIDQYWHGSKVSFYKKFSMNQPFSPLDFQNLNLFKE